MTKHSTRRPRWVHDCQMKGQSLFVCQLVRAGNHNQHMRERDCDFWIPASAPVCYDYRVVLGTVYIAEIVPTVASRAIVFKLKSESAIGCGPRGSSMICMIDRRTSSLFLRRTLFQNSCFELGLHISRLGFPLLLMTWWRRW